MASDDEKIDEFVRRRRFEPARIERDVENSALLLRRKAARQLGPELLDQHGDALLAPAAMSDGILDDDFLELRAVVELDGDRVGDRALVRVEVIFGKAAVLDADRLAAKRVDSRVGGDAILVIRGGETAEDQGDRDHVLDAM